jgi:hypothetical protein
VLACLIGFYLVRKSSRLSRAALAAAKARGKRLGGFRGRGTAADCARARQARTKSADARVADLAPVINDIRAGGAQSLRAIAAELNERGISAARGGEWSAALGPTCGR